MGISDKKHQKTLSGASPSAGSYLCSSWHGIALGDALWAAELLHNSVIRKGFIVIAELMEFLKEPGTSSMSSQKQCHQGSMRPHRSLSKAKRSLVTP